jgi:predicted nucleotidyltransferase
MVSTASVSDSNLGAVEPLVEAIQSRVEGLAAVCLFGSRARGDALPDSDLDLGIVREIIRSHMSELSAFAAFAMQPRVASPP